MLFTEIEPKEVFEYFKKIAKIPRGSGNMDGICKFCLDFAKEHGFGSFQDDAGNVMIFAPGSKGCEESEPIILQAHLDMVCDLAPDCALDMTEDPLDLCSEGDYLWAEGTSLGGDDGIAIAYILALLDSDTIMHPPIEVLFTVDEEIGMLGARNLDASYLTGRRLINLDSEVEGILTTSCAGAVRARMNITFFRDTPMNPNEAAYEIRISGLKGGHSGMDIHEGSKNSIKLLSKMLLELSEKFDYRLAEMHGGLKDNAIPKEASAILVFEDKNQLFAIGNEVESMVQKIKEELGEEVSGLRVSFVPVEEVSLTATQEESLRLLHFIEELPDGIWKMNTDIRGMVESSLNLAVVETGEDEMNFIYLLRSNVENGKDEMKAAMAACLEKYGASIDYYADYPAWEYNRDSALLEILTDAYVECYGTDPTVATVHAGLECGILVDKMPRMDCISFGPNMYNVHTANERLSISSAERSWKFLLKVLEKLCD